VYRLINKIGKLQEKQSTGKLSVFGIGSIYGWSHVWIIYWERRS